MSYSNRDTSTMYFLLSEVNDKKMKLKYNRVVSKKLIILSGMVSSSNMIYYSTILSKYMSSRYEYSCTVVRRPQRLLHSSACYYLAEKFPASDRTHYLKTRTRLPISAKLAMAQHLIRSFECQ